MGWTHWMVQSRGGMSSRSGSEEIPLMSHWRRQKKQLEVLVKLRRQKCGLRRSVSRGCGCHSTASRVIAGFIVSLFWRLHIPKSRCWQAVLSLGSKEVLPSSLWCSRAFLGFPWPPAAALWSPALMSHDCCPRVSLHLFCSL